MYSMHPCAKRRRPHQGAVMDRGFRRLHRIAFTAMARRRIIPQIKVSTLLVSPRKSKSQRGPSRT